MKYLTGTSLPQAISRLLSRHDIPPLLTQEEIKQCLVSFEGDELATFIFLKKYSMRDPSSNKPLEFSLHEAKRRWADAIRDVNERLGGPPDSSYWPEELYDYFLPAGRQMVALGNDGLKNVSLSNCYHSSIKGDSLEDIFNEAYTLAKTFAYSGGQGTCLGSLRPRGSRVSNSAAYSTGAVSFADLFSAVTGIIGQHARRGALLISMPVNHPDILEFIDAKTEDLSRLRYVNISVKITDEFMKAVEKDRNFDLSFETPHETISKTVKARYIWNRLVRAACKCAEPGILFWDTSVRNSTSEIYPPLQIKGVNPCSEILLDDNSACVLGSLLLHKFVMKPFTPEASIDWGLLKTMIHRGVNHLDNVVEINLSRHPLKEQREKARLGRRIGLGITGLADMLAALGLKYGSPKSVELVSKLFKFKQQEEYSASIELAKYRGAFPLFEGDKHYDQYFFNKGDFPLSLKEEGKKYGQRNVSISTIAPNGSVSLIGQCSAGIEPVFYLKQERVTELGDKRQTFEFLHPGLTEAIHAGVENPEKLFPSAHEIKPDQKIAIQSAAQQYIDSSISNTLNLPKGTSVETVSKIFNKAWKKGLKGITVYIDESREGIVSTPNSGKMDTVTHKFLAEGGDKFYVHISYRDKNIASPYQVFTTNYKATDNDRFVKMRNDLKRSLESLGTDSYLIDKQLQRARSSLEGVTRLISLHLKSEHFEECVGVLKKHAFIGTLAHKLNKLLSLSLKETNKCQLCGSNNVAKQEGCLVCMNCGGSYCG